MDERWRNLCRTVLATLRINAYSPQATEFHTDLHLLHVCDTSAPRSPIAVVEPIAQRRDPGFSEFTVTFEGLERREQVARWLVDPAGRRTDLTAVRTDSRGRFVGDLRIPAGSAVAGTWRYHFRGDRSGVEKRTFFSIWEPSAVGVADLSTTTVRLRVPGRHRDLLGTATRVGTRP